MQRQPEDCNLRLAVSHLSSRFVAIYRERGEMPARYFEEITSVVRKAILPIDPRLLHVKNAEFADDNTWRNISFLSRPPKQLCCKIKG
jgi:hypothetical protein